MAQVPSTIQEYMRQWLQIATQGNVTVEFALFVNRMELRCKACHALFRVDAPQDPTGIDWSVQQWVNRHVPGGVHDKDEIALPVAPTPVTADFKSPTVPGALFGKTGVIDISEAKAELMKAQMEKYKAEQATVDLEKKVAWLKQTEEVKEKIKKAEDDAAKEAAMQNLLNIMMQLTKNPAALKPLPKTPAPAPIIPEPPKQKPARITTGRRFR